MTYEFTHQIRPTFLHHQLKHGLQCLREDGRRGEEREKKQGRREGKDRTGGRRTKWEGMRKAEKRRRCREGLWAGEEYLLIVMYTLANYEISKPGTGLGMRLMLTLVNPLN